MLSTGIRLESGIVSFIPTTILYKKQANFQMRTVRQLQKALKDIEADFDGYVSSHYREEKATRIHILKTQGYSAYKHRRNTYSLSGRYHGYGYY